MLGLRAYCHNTAFSMVELLLVVLILGALAMVVVPRISQSSTQAKLNACKYNRDLIQRQMELKFHNTGSWPTNWTWFGNNKDYFPDGPPACPFGVAYDINNNHHRIKLNHDCLSGQ